MFGILCERPGCGFVNVLVGAVHQRHNLGQGLRYVKPVHRLADLTDKAFGHVFELFVKAVFKVSLRGDFSVEILFYHRNGATDKIAETVAKVVVVATEKRFYRENAVVAERNFSEQVIPYRVESVSADKEIRVNHVTLAFTHLVSAEQQPTVTVNVLGQR